MHFWYDAQGKPAMVSYNGNDYVYVYNAQGDVVALLDKANHHIQVVAYAYDPWGKQVACTGTMANTLGVENPFRYRGYAFDVETGLYYLRSRYYNPEWGRFVNADIFMGETGTLLSHNVFAYCDNNPVNLCDHTGLWSEENWAMVVPFSREEAYKHNEAYRNVHGTAAKETAILHIPVNGGESVVSIEVILDPIGDNYHIDTRFPSGSKIAGRDAMKGVAGKRWGKDTIVPAVLEFSDGTLAACSANLYPHVGSGSEREFKSGGGGHFDVYLHDSKQSSEKPSKEVLKFQSVAKYSYLLAQWNKYAKYSSTTNGKWQ